MPTNQEKENKFCAFGKLQIKEAKEDFHVSGYVATSHPDRAATEEFDGDIIPKSTLQKIVEDINNKYKPRAGAVSERHDHLKQQDINLPIAGVLAPGTSATLHELEEGHWGVHVDTILSKTNPRYEEVKTNIEQGVYPGFSIEYDTNNFVPTVKEGKKYRILTDISTEGFGYAHRRTIANPHAEYTDYGYKEIKQLNDKGETTMTATKEQAQKIIDDLKGKERKEIEAKLIEAKIPETMIKELLPAGIEDPAPAEPKPPADPVTPPVKPTDPAPSSKENVVSAEDFAMLTQFKEKQVKETQMKEITGSKEFKEALSVHMKEAKVKSSPLINPEGKTEFKEFDAFIKPDTKMKEFDKAMAELDIKTSNSHLEAVYTNSINEQYKEGGRLADSFMAKEINIWKNWRQMELYGSPADLVPYPKRNLGEKSAFKEVNNRIEAKEFHRLKNTEMKAGEGLQTDTNLADPNWTYGSYYLSPVELNDIFQPMLVNQLNDQTTTYGRLTKEDWSGRSQIQFRARTGQNSTVGGYLEGAAALNYGGGSGNFTGTVGRKKFQQPFCYYRVLVAITGQERRFGMAPGGMGDVWADEIKWSGVDLLSRTGTAGTAGTGLNRAVIGTGAGTAENISLGFEGLILGTTGTLYGKALSAEPTLRSHKEDMSSESVTLDQLRKMKRFVETGDGIGASKIHSNSNAGDLVFFANHLQVDFVKAVIQDMQRTVPTSARIGFEGQVEVDGIPFVADRQINTDDIFLINTAHTKLGVNLPPTLEPLPIPADASAAQIKTYWNLYSDAPGNNYWAHTFATS